MLKTSLLQILGMFVAIAAILGLFREFHAEDVVWRTNLLGYSIPEVPKEFREMGEGNFYRTDLPHSVWLNPCNSGNEIFLKYHRRGWEYRRHRFVASYKNPVIDKLPHKSMLTENNWNGHFEYAFLSGFQKCSDQLDDLLKTHDREKLKARLCYPRQWHKNALWGILVVACLAIYLFRPKRLPAN